MLSPHELATLMLLKDSIDQIADREELDTLIERQLVTLEQLAGGSAHPRTMQDEDPSFGLSLAFTNTTDSVSPHATATGARHPGSVPR
ncbi:hypothetical protein P3T40_008869 [Paraburkholderia sp. EB58]|uniref:hypothetical protein n=1 Tax=Paraburkholderia sp. EB58 TaxID=3035125 RepID=UPI003D2638D9